MTVLCQLEMSHLPKMPTERKKKKTQNKQVPQARLIGSPCAIRRETGPVLQNIAVAFFHPAHNWNLLYVTVYPRQEFKSHR